MPPNRDSGLAPASQRSLRVLLLLTWGVPTALFAALVVLAPSDVLSHAELLELLCKQVEAMAGSAIPRVDLFTHARSTTFPQVARAATAFAILWWPTPWRGLCLRS